MTSRRISAGLAAAALFLFLSAAGPSAAGPFEIAADADTRAAGMDGTGMPLVVTVDRSKLGRSGALRATFSLPADSLTLPLDWREPAPAEVRYRWLPVTGAVRPPEPSGMLGAPVPQHSTGGPSPADEGVNGERLPPGARLGAGDRAIAPSRPGIYQLELATESERTLVDGVRLIVLVPYGQLDDEGYIGRYYVGSYPPGADSRGARYAPPAGFIPVRREHQNLRLSDNFRLGEFLTHDQRNTWPKYVVVSPLLLDKLELVLAECERMGITAERMVVMSGFRTPQYNRNGGQTQGRATFSRHMWGDGADVWVDNDGDWYMDDLNGDGRRNTADARVMLRAVERVESRHPDLTGGAGIYSDNGVHGPFIHIDTRGHSARW